MTWWTDFRDNVESAIPFEKIQGFQTGTTGAYNIGNAIGGNLGSSFLGYDSLMNAIKQGQASLVDLYPTSVAKDGYWDTEYHDRPSTGLLYDAGEAGTQRSYDPVKMLKIGDKIYPAGPDWGYSNIAQRKDVPGVLDEMGQQHWDSVNTPTDQYRISSRADNNIFNQMNVKVDPTTGQLTAYDPNIYQTGQNTGGFLGDLKTMATETAPLWMGALGASLMGGVPVPGAEEVAAMQAASQGMAPASALVSGLEAAAGDLIPVGDTITAEQAANMGIPTGDIPAVDVAADDIAAQQAAANVTPNATSIPGVDVAADDIAAQQAAANATVTPNPLTQALTDAKAALTALGIDPKVGLGAALLGLNAVAKPSTPVGTALTFGGAGAGMGGGAGSSISAPWLAGKQIGPVMGSAKLGAIPVRPVGAARGGFISGPLSMKRLNRSGGMI